MTFDRRSLERDAIQRRALDGWIHSLHAVEQGIRERIRRQAATTSSNEVASVFPPRRPVSIISPIPGDAPQFHDSHQKGAKYEGSTLYQLHSVHGQLTLHRQR